jgi:hypothetical protein
MAIEQSVADISDVTTFSPRCQLVFPTGNFVQKQRALNLFRLNDHKETYAGVFRNLAKAPFRPRGGQSSIFRPGNLSPAAFQLTCNPKSSPTTKVSSSCMVSENLNMTGEFHKGNKLSSEPIMQSSSG